MEEEEEIVSFLAVAIEAKAAFAEAKFAVAVAKDAFAHFFFRLARIVSKASLSNFVEGFSCR